MPLIASGQDSPNCENVRKQSASVTVSFNYDPPSSAGGLANTRSDGNFFHRVVGNSISPARNTHLRDEDARGPKEQFLRRLRSAVGSANYVNLNYAGHGAVLRNGKWVMILPGAPRVSSQCWEETLDPVKSRAFLRNLKKGGGSEPEPSVNCSPIASYTVTTDDLQRALPGKKIFGILDSCHTGAAELSDGVLLTSAARDQVASDGEDKIANGLLTHRIKQLLTTCSSQSTEMTAADLTSQFQDTVPTDTSRTLSDRARQGPALYRDRSFGHTTSRGTQYIGLVQPRDQPWMSCLKLKTRQDPARCNDTRTPGSSPPIYSEPGDAVR